MSNRIQTVIAGTGCYLPPNNIPNSEFLNTDFYDENGVKFERSNQEIIEKFKDITTIGNRLYADDDTVTSDVAYQSAVNALTSSGYDKEELDYIIVAHNFGDLGKSSTQVDIVPSIACRVKAKLDIHNPDCVAYDVIFGCPGWLQAVIQADYYIRSGDAKKVMVIGSEVLSRIYDPHDRDSMLYSDGAGAVILEGKESENDIGILGHVSRSDSVTYSELLKMDSSNRPEPMDSTTQYLKMKGHKLYQYAIEHVPKAIKACLDKNNIALEDVTKILIHQANGKMDEVILRRLFQLYGIKEIPSDIMPMTVSWLGNSSVATLPTLLDLIQKGKLEGHSIQEGDILLFASVGAGMNINAMAYRA